MIQVALCGNLRLEDSDVLASLDRCAAARGVELAPVIRCASAVELIDRVNFIFFPFFQQFSYQPLSAVKNKTTVEMTASLEAI